MSTVVEGVVKYYDISEKSYKYGAKLHKITLTVGGEEVRASAFVKSNQPLDKAKPGDTVKTVIKEKDNGYNDFNEKQFKVTERSTSQVAATGRPGGGARDGDANIGMTRGNAIHAASRIVLAFASAGAYSSPDDAAMDLVRLADTYIMPYGMSGEIVNQDVGPEEPNSPVDDFGGAKDNDFDDDIPF